VVGQTPFVVRRMNMEGCGEEIGFHQAGPPSGAC